MGTRHLIIIYFNGQYWLAQYGQWDGYPEGQGIRILDFFRRAPDNLEKLKSRIHLVEKLSLQQAEQIYHQCEEIDREMQRNGTWDFTNHALRREYPTLSRDTSAIILDIIVAATEEKKVPVWLELDFAMDFLSCEWIYVIDLDRDILEVYHGGELKNGARSQRFVDLWANDEQYKDEQYAQNDYTPQMLGDFDLKHLPEPQNFLKYFNEILASNDEEDEENEENEEVQGVQGAQDE